MNVDELRDPIRFIQGMVRLEPSGELCKLEGWQRKVLGDLFPNGVGPLPYNAALLSAVKKCGKTSFVSAIATWHLFTGWYDSPGRPLILFCANSREQSTVLGFRKTCFSVERNKVLSASCDVYRDKIVTSTGGECRTIPTKPGAVAGLEPSMVIFDELWAADDSTEALFSELTAVPTRQCLLLFASYAGLNQDSLLFRLTKLAESGGDPKLYGFVSHDEKLSSWLTDEYLESERKRLLPSQYARLHQNLWVSPESAYIDLEDWGACYDPELERLKPTKEVPLSVGVDVGLRRDTSAIVGVYKDGDLAKVGFVKVYKPPRGGELDLEATVAKTLRGLAENYWLQSVNYDPRFMVSISQRLEAEGLPMQEVSPQRASMSPIFEILYQAVKRQELLHYGDKDLNSQIGHAMAIETSNGIMVSKKSRALAVDAVIALALACKDIFTAKPQIKIQVLRGAPETYPVTGPTLGPWRGMPKRRSNSGRLRQTARWLSRH